MASKGWVCRCGHDNVPDSPSFSASRCESCGRNRFVMWYVTATVVGGLLILVGLTFAVLRIAENQLRAMVAEAASDGKIDEAELQKINAAARVRWWIPKTRVDGWVANAVPLSPAPPISPTSQSPTIQENPKGSEPTIEAKQHFDQGINHALAKRYDNAILSLSEAIKVYPGYASAYANRGVAYLQQKKFNKARDDLEKARALDPRDPMIHYNLASLYSVESQTDRALDSLDQALDHNFSDYNALCQDPDLANVRRDKEFYKVLEKHKVFKRC